MRKVRATWLHSWCRTGLLLAVAAFGGCALAGQAKEPLTPDLRAPAADGRLLVQSFALNKYVRELDGQWQGIRSAADGNCYFASSTHSARNGATLWKYDPRANDLKLLCEDITKVCGEDPTQTPPQGKIHSDIAELGGWLYFGTHLANYWREGAAAYTGGHAVGYEMATGQFRDFGVVHPNYSNYSGVAVDKARRKLYFFVTPFSEKGKKEGGSRLYRLDLDTGAKEDLGQIKPGEAANQWMFVDRRGDCWFTMSGNDNGTLYRARATSQTIERFENALPLMTAWDRDAPAPEKQQKDRRWRWAQPLADGNRCLFIMNAGGSIWRFDSTKDLKDAFRPVAHIGPTDLGVALGGSRVFYVQQAGRKQFPREQYRDLHLCSVSLEGTAPLAITDHGAIVDAEGRTPLRIPSLAADDEGRVFMVGDWRLLPGEKGSLRHARTRDGQNVYNELPRGEFFAVVDLSNGLDKEKAK